MKRCPECGAEFPLDAGFCPHDGKILVALQDSGNPDARLGTQVGGRFFLVAIVADGANGRVYEARETTTRTKYAVKVLHEHAAMDRTAVERFKRESDTARQVDHPNVLKVYDFDRDPAVGFYLAMEFLDGENLGQLLARDGALPPPRAVRILSQVALALGAAHPLGFVHRDLKPENVFIVRGEDVRLLDFGSVKREQESGPKLTSMGTTLGSPYYMAPEQAKASPHVDARADVFSLACIAYEMLTGKIAFPGENVAAILFKILSENPTAPSFAKHDLPDAVDDVFRRGLAKQPNERTATADALVRDIARAVGIKQGSPETWAKEDPRASALPEGGPPPGDDLPAPTSATAIPTPVWIAIGIAAGAALVVAVALVFG